MEGLFWFIALMASLALNGLTIVLSYKKVNKVLDRAKAKDLEEFKYYEQEYPKEVEHKAEVLKGTRKAKKKKAFAPNPKDVKTAEYAKQF